jgi:gliding motility-associated lipoprotein GldH
MTRIKLINFICLSFLFLLVSCGKSPYYSKVYSFKNDRWKASDLKTFVVDVKDTTSLYDIVFFIRVGTDYDYNNAWIYLHSTLPDHTTYKEAHQFYVSNDVGEWLGNKSGSLVESEMIFAKKKFNKLGKYTFSIEQATTEKELKHISDIGLKIIKSTNRQ